MKFKKIISVIASAIMLSSTMGFAAAASYPEPFVSGGTADSAVVVGGGAAVAITDWAAAIDMQENLQALVTTAGAVTGATVTGGDSIKFEKTSRKWHLGDGLLDVRSTAVTDDNMPSLLADGTFIDDDNDEFDFTQKIEMANSSLTMFDDNDYQRDTPTVGIKINSGVNVLNYTLEFSEDPVWTDLETADLTLMGKTYYVLDVNYPTNTTLTLLDAAVDTVLAEGDVTTLNVDGKSYEVSISFIGSSSVKLVVDGETTKSLAASETYKLSDGAYVGVKEILVQDYAGGIKNVEFSIGKGKLVLEHDADVELNEDSIDDLSVSLGGQGGSALTSIKIIWEADDELFVTPDSEVTMPGFEALKLSFTGMIYPTEEEIKIENSGNTNIVLSDFPLKDSVEDIYLLEWAGADEFNIVGKDSDEVLVSTNATSFTFNKNTDEWFVASWSDGNDAESYLMRATSFKTENDVNKTTFEYRKDGLWVEKKKEADSDDSFTLGNVEITVDAIDKDAKTVVVTRGNIQMSFNTLYSKEGMKVFLPWNRDVVNHKDFFNATNYANDILACAAGGGTLGTGEIGSNVIIYYNRTSTGANYTGSCAVSTFALILSEEDKNENIGVGSNFTVTLAERSAATDEVDVNGISISGSSGSDEEIDDTDVYRNFAYSELATEMLFDKSGDQEILALIYHGDEVYGEVFLSAPEVVITPGTTTIGGGGQVLVVKDSEVSSVSGKNLVVVGGSCINTVAAKILGSETPVCESAFTDLTGVGAGQYIIKTIASPYAAADSGKVAMLVAGYNAADTVNAVAKALEGVTSDVDTEQVYPITTA